MSSSRWTNQQGRRRWVRALTLLPVAAVVAAMTQVSSPQAASAANVVNETYEFPLAITMNTCSTPVDAVALSGELHIVVTTTSNGGGGYDVRSDSNTEYVTGVGLVTGDAYTSSSEDVNEYTVGGPFPETDTVTDRYELISKGSNGNLYMDATFQETIPADGIPVVTLDNVSSACHG